MPPDLVHALHLAYIQVVPVQRLVFELDALRKDYRSIVDAATYEAYQGSPAHAAVAEGGSKESNADLLRGDATFLANETRRLSLFKQHLEKTRQRLVRAAFASWCWNVIPFTAIVLVYLFCQSCADDARNRANPPAGAQVTSSWASEFANAYLLKDQLAMPEPLGATNNVTYNGTPLMHALTAAAVLALAGIAGATGGMISVVQRIQTDSTGTDAAADLRALAQAEGAVFFAPITGAIFAVVLSTMIAGRVVSGSIFPTLPENAAWYFVLWLPWPLANWFLWGFIAGFSERLVPDMLNRIAKDAEGKLTGQAPANAEQTAKSATAGTLPDEQPADEAEEELHPEQPAAPEHTDLDDGTNVVPELNAYAGAVPPDAVEVTVTGRGFTVRTDVFLNEQKLEKEAILQVTATSLRLRLTPTDLAGKSTISVKVVNPQPGGGESQVLTIPVNELGG